MKKITAPFLLLATLAATSVSAQQMPAPRAMPRTPVNRQNLMEPRDPMPASRQLQGPAAIIDGEKLRIGETDLRLFGIVPPQLSASFGPQARAALDALANGQNVSCQIRDRDRDGRLLATCHNAGGADMALELLKRGLAVTARGSVAGTELATSYLAAEQAAQSEKLGLWSVTASMPAVAATTTTAPRQESAALPAATETKKDDKVAPRTDKAASIDAQTQAKIAADVTTQQAQARIDDSAWAQDDGAGFFERYQVLIAGLLMLATALGITGALWEQKRRDRRDETRAIAAALRGELMAMRGVCAGRARDIKDESEDRTAGWPRLRSTLYQAYVGRLGLLGAELARHISSIYGQSSDYAALYNPAGTTHDAPKKHALETLAKRIDEVLPKLARIEQTGRLPFAITPSLQYRAVTMSAHQPGTETALAQTGTADETAAAHVSPQGSTVIRTPAALWENMRGFLHNHRNIAALEPQQAPADPNVSEYAAMIEADMARYQYSENIESLDISPKKKSG